MQKVFEEHLPELLLVFGIGTILGLIIGLNIMYQINRKSKVKVRIRLI